MSLLKRVSGLIVLSGFGLFAFQNCAQSTSEIETLVTAAHLNHFTIVNMDQPELDHSISSKAYISSNNSQARWPNNSVSWYYNDSGRPSQLDKAQVIATLQQSAAVWSQISGFQFHYAGETGSVPQVTVSVAGAGLSVTRSCSSSSSDRIVGWSSLPTVSGGSIGGAVAVCLSSGQLKAFGMKINSNSGYGESLEAIRKIAQHEFGHALGLGDFDATDAVGSCTAADTSSAIMYGWADLGAALRQPNTCDRHYSQALYGQSPQVIQVCIPHTPQVCMLANQQMGMRTCNSTGTAWSICAPVVQTQICVPGSIQTCFNDTRMVQTCNPDGQSWGACVFRTKGQIYQPPPRLAPM